ncbi:hypothetical protein QC760_008248 [Botrytis cinerea]
METNSNARPVNSPSQRENELVDTNNHRSPSNANTSAGTTRLPKSPSSDDLDKNQANMELNNEYTL